MVAPLNPDIEQFVNSEISSGRFPDREAVIAFALRLMQRERHEALTAIQEGLADVEAGRTQPLAEAFQEMRKELGLSDAI